MWDGEAFSLWFVYSERWGRKEVARHAQSDNKIFSLGYLILDAFESQCV